MRIQMTCLALALSLTPFSTRAEVIATCQNPTGQAASLGNGGAVSWESDGFADTSISILRDADGRYDVAFKGPNNDFTARGDGASIFADDGLRTALTLVAKYPLGTVDTFALSAGPKGTGTLIWSSMKNRVGGVTRGFLLTATCRRE